MTSIFRPVPDVSVKQTKVASTTLKVFTEQTSDVDDIVHSALSVAENTINDVTRENPTRNK